MTNLNQRSPSPEFCPLAIGPDLSPLPHLKAAGTTSVDFAGLLSSPLLLHEDLSSGCGGQTWPAGMLLAKHMLRYHRDDLRESRILELGAGGGLVGLAVAKGCNVEKPLVITDQRAMLSLMKHNISLNQLDGEVEAVVLDWGELLGEDILHLKPDVILAADCVYFEPAFPLLLTTLADLLTLCPSAQVFFCFKKRRRADMQFLKKAQKAFNVVEIMDEDRPVFSRQGLFLYSFTAKTQQRNGS
ncbi:putative methyltransferase-domain-containing protein [Pseudomassariella vexata]|uniref:Protein-lysine N-methyltransferase EFM6 n=1 Tax=Pseudomassariella vexata TaxID=1141098 RepID=A0A1Y2E249_9PEZI|nr:putative methyltransferase-domain-containing protein [Pseudomassariella vexata]ORY65396.1 putative methyltransferase-domain-containing protein [Pseudomassariella vexata]